MNSSAIPAPSRPAGFTLVELLAALAIFAIFAVMAYAGLGAVLKSKTNVERALQRTAELQKAIYRLESDFEQAQNRPVRDDYGDLRPAFALTQDGLVEFTRGGWRNPTLQPRSSLERVAYGFHEGKLTRYTWAALDRAEREQPAEVVILQQLRSVEWHFMDAQHAWQEDWPVSGGDDAHPLPMAVEVVLDTEDWGEIRYLFRIVAGAVPTATPGGSPDKEGAEGALPGDKKKTDGLLNPVKKLGLPGSRPKNDEGKDDGD